MGPRGWTRQAIDNALQNPLKTGSTINRATGNSATAYFVSQNQYVVVDDVNRGGEVTRMDACDINYIGIVRSSKDKLH